MGFFKAGNLHRPAMASQERRHKESLGSRRRAPGAREGQAGQGSVMETITLESDSDNDSLEEMEEKLVRMIEQRLKRKRCHNSLE